ncbi:MAG: hypothetical protein ACRYF0_21275 [Janthinobacterium lividum]
MGRATQRYAASTQAESHLLNGREYVNPAAAYVVGHPFFLASRPQRGTIIYDGSYFAQVPLLYEQAQDQVVLFDSVRNVNIQLVSDKVAAFTLGSHRFLRLRADSTAALPTGFYELLVDGPARLLARRTKTATKVVSGQGITGEYEPATRFFVQRQNRYYPVTKLGQVLRVLTDKKSELQQFARGSQLKFKDANREASLTQLLQYYAELAR